MEQLPTGCACAARTQARPVWRRWATGGDRVDDLGGANPAAAAPGLAGELRDLHGVRAPDAPRNLGGFEDPGLYASVTG